MKKIAYIFSVLLVAVVTMTSCDINRSPRDAGSPEQGPFTSIISAQQNRDALYALLRGVETPDNLSVADVQSDLYHLTFLDNNSLNGLYNWRRQAVQDHKSIVAYYSAFYRVLMQTNYFLWRAQELLDSKEYSTSEADRKLLEQYIAEAKVMRALAHWRLVTRFSKPWDGKTDDEQFSGIVQILSYNPLEGAKDVKATRAEVYKQAIKDLDEAIAAIPAEANKEVKPAIYITKDYANAVKARVCLFMKDWDGAINAVNAFINNYPLTKVTGNKTDDVAALERLWKYEDSEEILVRLKATAQYGVAASFLYAGEMKKAYKSSSDKEMTMLHFITPSLVLEQWIIDLYDDADIRKTVYIGQRGFYRTDYGLNFHSVTKFEGNPALNQDPKINDFVFGVHLFNVGEAYLIKAEALLGKANTGEAIAALTELRKARGLTTSSDDYGTIEEVTELLRKERIRELIGEGFRLNDIQRWGIQMKRSEHQKGMDAVAQAFDEPNAVHSEGRLLEKDPATEPMFVWEFPTRDMENNENLNTYRNWR